ncbi:hypothetical protein BYT27DRAFT_6747358 [Phlegmacium glaucopus]|nr:hypothetical protein BYT27DRAFT_6747358 [Phlegmacium glaucopus]
MLETPLRGINIPLLPDNKHIPQHYCTASPKKNGQMMTKVQILRPQKDLGKLLAPPLVAPQLLSTITASELDINPANHPNTSLGSNSSALSDAENH